VDLVPDEPPLDEAVNTLLYRVSEHSYREIQSATRSLSSAQKTGILDAAFASRGAHDEPLPELRVGYPFKFDILMDVGGFRDLHRHRRCVQICQELTPAHGYETPPDIRQTGLGDRYDSILGQSSELFATLAAVAPQAAAYALPLGFRRRALFKMDFAEAQYICELRTAPQGHFAYQAIAYKMYQRLTERCPELARFVRVDESCLQPDTLRR
jgi:hypothetical protein